MISKQPRLIPLADWPKYHAWPPLGGLRHLVFYSKTNGFDKVIRRAGRRILIDEAAFFDWVEQKSEEQGLPAREVGNE
ncbi:hypothetical protein KQI63_08900 [bacterium]|nr:hypothetical protein [bacterium]